MDLTYVEFQQVDLNDVFFDSLKQDYVEFEAWFAKKAHSRAYVHRTPDGKLDGFLYLKSESEALEDLEPQLPSALRLKVGTFKIDAHGTKLGERFVKKIFDHALAENSQEIYVTIFVKHGSLIKLLSRYGFSQVATKTTANGTELVLLRKMEWVRGRLDINYPLVNLAGSQYLMSLKPIWNTRLLPDSILKTEDADVLIHDVSHGNSIHKVYLTAMSGVDCLKRGDALVIYRTAEKGAAYYTSVATSVCVVEEFRYLRSFSDEKEFLDYCVPYSVFTLNELKSFFKYRKFPFVIRFTYNFALKHRPTRKVLIEEIGLVQDQYWGFFQLTRDDFKKIMKKGQINESVIVD